MSGIEWLNYSEVKPVETTGTSSTPEYQNPNKKLKKITELSERDKNIELLLSDSNLLKNELDSTVELILSYDESEHSKIINTIKENFCEKTDDVEMCISLLWELKKEKEETDHIIEAETKLKEVKSEVKEVKSEVKESKEKLEKEVLSILNKYTFDNIEINEAINAKDFGKILTLLESDKSIFDSVVKTIRDNSPEGSKDYENFIKNISIISTNTNLQTWIDSSEVIGEVSQFASTSFMATNSTVISRGDKSLTLRKENGSIVEHTEDSRRISVEWGTYKLESKIPITPEKQIKDFEDKISSENKKINEELNSLTSILDFIEQSITENLDIVIVKEKIKSINIELYNELWIDNANDLQSIKSSIVAFKSNKEEKKKDQLKKQKRELQELIKRNNKLTEDVDRKKENILRFIKNSWLWIIPQDKIDQIIAEFKWWLTSIKWLKLKRDNLDISNWMFWEETSESWKDWFWDVAKENIKMFMEKMLYWEVWSENSIFKWIDFTKNFTIDPTKMIWECSKWKNALYDWINWNITAMKDNLAK